MRGKKCEGNPQGSNWCGNSGKHSYADSLMRSPQKMSWGLWHGHETPQRALTQPMTCPMTHPHYEYFSRWCTVVCIWHSSLPSAHSIYMLLWSLTITIAMPSTEFLCHAFLTLQSVAWFPLALPQTTKEVSWLSCHSAPGILQLHYNPLGPPSWLAVRKGGVLGGV